MFRAAWRGRLDAAATILTLHEKMAAISLTLHEKISQGVAGSAALAAIRRRQEGSLCASSHWGVTRDRRGNGERPRRSWAPQDVTGIQIAARLMVSRSSQRLTHLRN